MTKLEAKRVLNAAIISHDVDPRLWKPIEVYAAACAAEALQPKRTGRLPMVGMTVSRLCSFSGAWVRMEVKGRYNDAFWFADGLHYSLQAEGVTWRWPDAEKGAKRG